MKFAFVSGARPQFIKLAPILKAFEELNLSFFHVHTGQHYDVSMSDQIFKDLQIPSPEYNLNVGSDSHAKQTAKMLVGLEEIFIKEEPDYVIVPGDTNSTLAGALTAVKLKIPVIHLEAGLRSNDWNMPEELNRIIVDRVSRIHVAHTLTGLIQLVKEGADEKFIILSGDPMVDSLYATVNREEPLENKLPVQDEEFLLMTMHRAENVDVKEKMETLYRVIKDSPLKILFPAHPRTLKKLKEFELYDKFMDLDNLILSEPMGYLKFSKYLSMCKGVITDSGGLQKEAFILSKPCITMRTTTEWVESLELGANRLLGFDKEKVLSSINEIKQGSFAVTETHPYGNGRAGAEITNKILTLIKDTSF